MKQDSSGQYEAEGCTSIGTGSRPSQQHMMWTMYRLLLAYVSPPMLLQVWVLRLSQGLEGPEMELDSLQDYGAVVAAVALSSTRSAVLCEGDSMHLPLELLALHAVCMMCLCSAQH